MSVIKLPTWVNGHLYEYRDFNQLTAKEVADLRDRLYTFSNHQPQVTIVIPAWNESATIHRALSSLAANRPDYPTEIIVINNNSTDNTQEVLDKLGVKSFLETKQGPSHARQLGLEMSKGKYHLCADADTLYPPDWINSMVRPMIEDPEIVCVYGRYSFIPERGEGRFNLFVYELITSVLIKIRKTNHEFINVLGFNMGFVAEHGKSTGGFKVNQARIFDNAKGSKYFVDEAEDGTMALNLLSKGKLKQLSDKSTRTFTSSRRLSAEGGVFKAFSHRIKFHGTRLSEYLTGFNRKDQ